MDKLIFGCGSVVMKSGSLNLLDPSGPVQACNGIALPLPLVFIDITKLSFTYPRRHCCSDGGCSAVHHLVQLTYSGLLFHTSN
jgi:hypothetical protein